MPTYYRDRVLNRTFKMAVLLRSLMWIAGFVAVVWTALTLWVEADGPERIVELGKRGFALTALIVYDPDPIYNLDQQVCESFARGLADKGWHVTVATVRMAKKFKETDYHLYVFCANTYNWLPDRSITNFIKDDVNINRKNIVAIIVGAGSTRHAQEAFEKVVRKKNGNLIDSKTFWLLRPNDEARLKHSNVATAVDIARKWGGRIAELAITKQYTIVR